MGGSEKGPRGLGFLDSIELREGFFSIPHDRVVRSGGNCRHPFGVPGFDSWWGDYFFFNPMLRRPTPQSMFDFHHHCSTPSNVHGFRFTYITCRSTMLVWGQLEASVLFGGVRRAAAHPSLLLLMGQAMLTVLLCTHSSLPK